MKYEIKKLTSQLLKHEIFVYIFFFIFFNKSSVLLQYIEWSDSDDKMAGSPYSEQPGRPIDF